MLEWLKENNLQYYGDIEIDTKWLSRLSKDDVPEEPCGVLIEPGVQLYKGGNVTICLLASGIFLFSFHCRTHLLFGMCSYDWVHCLILLDSSNSVFIEL